MRPKTTARIGVASLCALSTAVACSSSDPGTDDQSTETVGGTSAAVGGSSRLTSSATSAGGKANGGSTATGGVTSGGTSARGGTSSGVGSSSGGSGVGSSGVGSSGVGGDSSSTRSNGGVGGRSASSGGTSASTQYATVGGSGDTATALGGRNSGGTRTSGGSSTSTASVGGSSRGGSTSATSSKGGTASGGVGGTSRGGTASGGTSIGATTSGGSSVATGDDGCTDSPALGLTISEIAVFQSGKIGIMKAGSEVAATSESGAEIIEGRDTVFRAYVTVDSGFQSRQLSARLTLNGSAHYFAKQSISASSTELSTANSFMIAVPASAMTAGLTYSLQIVECSAGTGTAHNPVFPASGSASLATRSTGVIKVSLIPVTANNITPTLDGLSVSLKQYIEAVYPTTKAEITVSATPVTGCTIAPSTATDGTAWSKCLTAVRNRRTSDRPANDIYYMGIVTPASTYSAYCGQACVAGISYVATSAGTSAGSARVALAVGYEPQGLSSIGHELGHSHGLEHSPGCGADQPDNAFPYIKSGTAYIGWVGWDRRSSNTLFDPAKYKDMMAYCEPAWVSDYVYAQFADRIAALNGAALLSGSNAVSTWRVLDVFGGEASWGTPIVDPTAPTGEPESATVLDAAGNGLLEITVYRTAISDARGAMYLVPEPSANWSTLRIGSMSVRF